ncbi:MAG: hypothetical protein F6K31_40475 [Symploca sp. SIO2G7]|nr:hypothetical protein [Symploca sp. SIO2G7]
MATLVPQSGFLEKRYGLDLRSLALLRVGLALVILADLLTRTEDLAAHYTDAGVLPRQAAINILPDGYWSFHLISGQPWGQSLLFLVAMTLALALLVGYHTRLITIASWVMIVSLHNRNPIVLFAADDILRAAMFWAMFLPLGAKYSIDSALNTASQRLPDRFFGAATIALMVQQCYFPMLFVFLKASSPNWWTGSSAYPLSFEQHIAPVEAWFLNLKSLSPILTFFILVLGWVGPLFLFVPLRTNLFRNSAIVTSILLYLGIGLTLNHGIFSALSIVTWLVFIPTSTWKRWTKRFYGPEQHGLVIYYDADCGFCKKVVHLIRTFLLLPDTPLCIAQSDPDIFAAMEHHNSWVVVDWQGHYHYKFEAIAYVCSISPVFWIFAPVLRWSFVMTPGTRFYKAIANNRRQAGLFTRPLKFKSFSVHASWLNNRLAIVMLVLISIWNLCSATYHHAFIDSANTTIQTFRRVTSSVSWLHWPIKTARLDYSQSFVAPSLPHNGGWYVVKGTLANGSIVDLLQPKHTISTEQSTLVQRQALYETVRWRNYFSNLSRSRGVNMYLYYGDYVCRHWNNRRGDHPQLQTVGVFFINESKVPSNTLQTITENQLWQQSCRLSP